MSNLNNVLNVCQIRNLTRSKFLLFHVFIFSETRWARCLTRWSGGRSRSGAAAPSSRPPPPPSTPCTPPSPSIRWAIFFYKYFSEFFNFNFYILFFHILNVYLYCSMSIYLSKLNLTHFLWFRIEIWWALAQSTLLTNSPESGRQKIHYYTKWVTTSWTYSN